jgi:hypothetical protein
MPSYPLALLVSSVALLSKSIVKAYNKALPGIASE